MRNSTLLIDFDRTLHNTDEPIIGRRMGAPIDGAKEALTSLEDQGFKIVIFTLMAATDSGKKAVADWMEYYQLPYHDITNVKTDGIIIDDKAIRFRDWKQALLEIETFEV